MCRKGHACHVLVHRRSANVSQPDTICAPGGWVIKSKCTVGGRLNFDCGARKTALWLLQQNTGLAVAEDELRPLLVVDGKYAYALRW